MLSRRTPTLSLLFIAAAAVSALAVSTACNESSNTVTGVTGVPSANLTGSWSGTFSTGASGCSSVPMSATLTQEGNRVRGLITASGCVSLNSASLRATVSGNMITGSVGMIGCTGGAISGTVSADGTRLTFAMDDLRKPLVTGDQIIAPGGDATLRK